MVVISPHIVFQVVLKCFVLSRPPHHYESNSHLAIGHLFAIACMQLTVKKDCVLFQLSKELSDADRLEARSSTLRTNHFPFPYLSSSNRNENDSNEEVPDEKVEREEKLAGPVDLADGHVHLHQLARVDVAF